MSAPRTIPKLLSIKQAAQLTGLQRFRLYEACRSGLPHLRVGRTIRIPEDQLAVWIQDQTERSAGVER
jgi:excisionase family DNA binding protein